MRKKLKLFLAFVALAAVSTGCATSKAQQREALLQIDQVVVQGIDPDTSCEDIRSYLQRAHGVLQGLIEDLK